MSALIGSLSLLSVYVYFIIPLAPVVYIFVKWRSYRDGAHPDPQLGAKTILYYFKTIAYHVVLAGLTALLYGLIKDRSSEVQTGFGLLVSGGIIYLVHSFLIHRLTNTIEYPLTARIYTGFNLIITGFVAMISFIYLTVSAFKGSSDIELPLAGFIVYTIAWVFQTTLFCRPSIIRKIWPFPHTK